MSEEPDDETLDWSASDFGCQDYVDDRRIAAMVVRVADGTQVDPNACERGWASSKGTG